MGLSGSVRGIGVEPYIGPIYRYLARGESAAFIARHLCFIEESAMGLGKLQTSARLPVAVKLKAIDLSPQGMDSLDDAGGS